MGVDEQRNSCDIAGGHYWPEVMGWRYFLGEIYGFHHDVLVDDN
jgi:hypothetical protein